MQSLETLLSHHGLSAILDHIHAIVILAEKDGALIAWNRAFEPYKAGFRPNGKLGDLFTDTVDTQSRSQFKKMERWVTHIFPDEDKQNGLLCDCMLLPLADGKILFVAEIINSAPKLLDKVDRLSKQVEVFKNESETAKKLARRKEVEMSGVMAQASEISHIDALTLLPNRRKVLRQLEDEVQRAQRYHTPLTISILDIDYFKKINDTYGHLAGDEVLKQIGQILTDYIRHPDMAGRYGGEEFLVLLPNSDAQAAADQAARLCKRIRETNIQTAEQILNITISVGITEYQKTDTWETLINRADAALYEAKSGGRDRWVIKNSQS
ncbi:MAG: GGDEF domain-containing protein [Anaerolineales bacterium]|nr:GGDEF domain-containing protein [Anaerolineales bacterium]MCZ2121546.1 GGDEF domain-containing protein [Anaerolineales bacterium]